MRVFSGRRLAAILACAVASVTIGGSAQALLGGNSLVPDLGGAGSGGLLGLDELLGLGDLLDVGNVLGDLLDVGSLLNLEDLVGGGLGVLSNGS